MNVVRNLNGGAEELALEGLNNNQGPIQRRVYGFIIYIF